jgi:excinuclease ABC subunit A
LSQSHIEVSKLCVANWRGGDVSIPKNQWTAVTGPSGSGKTSLLFGALEAWSARQFELLNNPAAVVCSFNNQYIAANIHGLTPVLASAGEIPRQRRNTLLIDMLHLHPLLQQWWKQQGRYRCAQCDHSWRPFSVAEVIANLESRVNDSAVMVLSHTSSELVVDELLLQGLTRYYQDGELQRIEDVGETLEIGRASCRERVFVHV